MPDRDSGGLKKELRKHSVDGYPVHVPLFGEGTIEGNGVRLQGRLFYRVHGKRAIGWNEYARALRYSDAQMTYEQYIQTQKQRGVPKPESTLTLEMQERFEAGGTASDSDIHRSYVKQAGCLDEGNVVICHDFEASSLFIPLEKLQPGMLVEFHDEKMNKDFQGKVVGVQEDGGERIVLLESFEPVPFMDAPEALSPKHIQPGFYSEYTYKIGYGTYEALQKAKVPLPPGKAQTDPESRRQYPHYLLNDPIPLGMLQEFCSKNYPDQPYCFWQAIVLYIIPIHPEPVSGDHQGGKFTPLPTDLARSGEIQVWDVESFAG